MRELKIKTLILAGILVCAIFLGQSLAQQTFDQDEPRIIVVTSEAGIDWNYNFIELLNREDIPFVLIKGPEFNKYKHEKYMIILGGPNEADGIGEITKQLLTSEEKAWINQPGHGTLYEKTDILAPDQTILLIAGYNMNAISKARVRYNPVWWPKIVEWFGMEGDAQENPY